MESSLFQQKHQLVDSSQTRFAADVLHFLERNHTLGNKSIPELLDFIDERINSEGLGSFSLFQDQHPGDIARIRTGNGGDIKSDSNIKNKINSRQ